VDRIEAMAAFVAVAEQRGFAAAARRLRRSPPAVTRLVAALEEHLGLRLLHRTTRAVALTDAGARYLERARRILAELGEAEAAARAIRSEPAGRLVVAAPSVFGRRLVAPVVGALLARHPAVRAELRLGDGLVNLVEEGVDVAVRIGNLSDSSLRVRPVGATRRVLVASPAYLEGHGRPRRPADLARHRTLAFSSLVPLAEWTFARGPRKERVAVEPAFASNGAEAVAAEAVRGAGIALLLSYQVWEELAAGALERLLPRWEPSPIPIQIVHPAGRLPSAAVRAFTELAIAARWDFDSGDPSPSRR
jgi:DNA-binding transcriptional LysR family regulator